MNPMLRNILVAICAAFLGATANMALIISGGYVIAPPLGVDLNTAEGLAAGMHLMEPRHFLFPFLAHAVGSLVGAFVVARFAATRHMQLAMIITSLFFVGGLQMVLELPSPMWFNVTDLVLAYYPMGLLGYKWGKRRVVVTGY
jgi:hypothetical protein